MDPIIYRDIVEDICAAFFKICTISIGMCIVYLGYKLFSRNLTGEAGDLQGEYGKYKLILKKTAPGTFFVLFGSIIISVAVFKGINFTSSDYSKNSESQRMYDTVLSQPPILPPHPPQDEK